MSAVSIGWFNAILTTTLVGPSRQRAIQRQFGVGFGGQTVVTRDGNQRRLRRVHDALRFADLPKVTPGEFGKASLQLVVVVDEALLENHADVVDANVVLENLYAFFVWPTVEDFYAVNPSIWIFN